jgi:hypothetical protein
MNPAAVVGQRRPVAAFCLRPGAPAKSGADGVPSVFEALGSDPRHCADCRISSMRATKRPSEQVKPSAEKFSIRVQGALFG